MFSDYAMSRKYDYRQTCIPILIRACSEWMDRSRSLCIHEDATRGQAWCRHSHDLHIWTIDICKCCANLGSVLPKIRPAISARRAAGQSGTHLKPGFEMGTREESCSLTHTYIHTYIHTYMDTYVHTHIRTYVHTYIHTYGRVCAYVWGNECYRCVCSTSASCFLHVQNNSPKLVRLLRQAKTSHCSQDRCRVSLTGAWR